MVVTSSPSDYSMPLKSLEFVKVGEVVGVTFILAKFFQVFFEGGYVVENCSGFVMGDHFKRGLLSKIILKTEQEPA